MNLDIVAETDVQFLPTGVGVQLLNDIQINGVSTSGSRSRDNFLRTGCIMFDKTGVVELMEYDVKPTSKLGQYLMAQGSTVTLAGRNPNTLPPVRLPAGGLPALNSCLGLVLYDRQAFISKGFDENDPTYNAGAGSRLANLRVDGSEGPNNNPNPSNEERWLNEYMIPDLNNPSQVNSIPLIVNRFNGTLLKGE
jgi:hypothetical protein